MVKLIMSSNFFLYFMINQLIFFALNVGASIEYAPSEHCSKALRNCRPNLLSVEESVKSVELASKISDANLPIKHAGKFLADNDKRTKHDNTQETTTVDDTQKRFLLKSDIEPFEEDKETSYDLSLDKDKLQNEEIIVLLERDNTLSDKNEDSFLDVIIQESIEETGTKFVESIAKLNCVANLTGTNIEAAGTSALQFLYTLRAVTVAYPTHSFAIGAIQGLIETVVSFINESNGFPNTVLSVESNVNSQNIAEISFYLFDKTTKEKTKMQKVNIEKTVAIILRRVDGILQNAARMKTVADFTAIFELMKKFEKGIASIGTALQEVVEVLHVQINTTPLTKFRFSII